jgi:N-acetylglutamate synthase-like GNAT family acetyltransferase
MASGFTTRAATLGDAPALAALINSAYRGESSKAGWSTEADLLGGQRTDVDWIADMIRSPGNVILVHEEAGVLVGCVHLERTGEECYLGLLTVLPTLQARGVGRQLIAAAEAWAVEHWGSRSMHMTVITLREELLAWYQRRGYQRTGKRKPFPYGDERFGLPRRPDLEFEVLKKSLM